MSYDSLQENNASDCTIVCGGGRTICFIFGRPHKGAEGRFLSSDSFSTEVCDLLETLCASRPRSRYAPPTK